MSNPVVSIGGNFTSSVPTPRTFDATWRQLWSLQLGSLPGIWWEVARSAGKHATMLRTGPNNEESSDPKVSGAKTKTHWAPPRSRTPASWMLAIY